MARHKIREKLKRSQFYPFKIKPRRKLDASQDTSDCARIVYCNQPHMHKKKPLKYRSNAISTTKYNFLSFLPKALFEQFNRVANIYFLIAALLSLTPISPFTAASMLMPLAIVIGVSIAKEGLEDWRRLMQDREVNARKASVHVADGVFAPKEWEQIQVGDIVKVDKDQFFPADLVFLSSSYEDGICYVETMNLDGETNLKVKHSFEQTSSFADEEEFKSFEATVKCEDPNPSLYTFIGNIDYDRQVYALDPGQILLRDSKLRNTTYVYGAVIFTGHDSKVMQNATSSPSKRSRIEKQMDKIIFILFGVLIVISVVSSIGSAILTKLRVPKWWYLAPYESTDVYFNPGKPVLPGLAHLVTALILYGYLIPISLYVSIEIVKFLQAIFINHDIHLYDEDSGIPTQARTSNLNEELGQVETILSDKTGTLTCNQMDFLKCSIAGIPYGVRASEVELAAAKQMANDMGVQNDQSPPRGNQENATEIELESVITSKDGKDHKRPPIKYFSFEDSRLTEGNWVKEPNVDVLLLFFRILAVCHTAIPDQNEETGAITYEAESPDEGAFLVAAREFGFEFVRRTQSSVFIREKYTSSGQTVER